MISGAIVAPRYFFFETGARNGRPFARIIPQPVAIFKDLFVFVSVFQRLRGRL